jgi:hypothetical protein
MVTTPDSLLTPLSHGLTLTISGGPTPRSLFDLTVPQERSQLALARGIFVIGLTEGVACADEPTGPVVVITR